MPFSWCQAQRLLYSVTCITSFHLQLKLGHIGNNINLAVFLVHFCPTDIVRKRLFASWHFHWILRGDCPQITQYQYIGIFNILSVISEIWHVRFLEYWGIIFIDCVYYSLVVEILQFLGILSIYPHGQGIVVRSSTVEVTSPNME